MDNLGENILERKISGRVIKGVGGKFSVETDEGLVVCYARGLFKREEDSILIGDYVELSYDHNWLITDVLPRKNVLIRPPVSNIDVLVIVLASEPEPDYYLLDKLLLTCFDIGIKPVICVNKIDLSENVYNYVKGVYGEFVDIYAVSTVNDQGLRELVNNLKGTVCFSGQSAVGKTSILNSICSLNEQTGELSKILRGRNTTRHVQIYKVNDNFQIIDTCGFSLLTEGLPKREEIWLYYPDFMKFVPCKYRSCLHITEPECAIRTAVKQRKLDLNRYYRYLTIIGARKNDKD